MTGHKRTVSLLGNRPIFFDDSIARLSSSRSLSGIDRVGIDRVGIDQVEQSVAGNTVVGSNTPIKAGDKMSKADAEA